METLVALKTIDIPQADGLASVRRLLEAMATAEGTSTKQLSEMTGFSERHVRYRMATARILNFVADEAKKAALTPRGQRLLRTTAGSPDEKRELRRAVADCPVVREIAPGLLGETAFEFDSVAKTIARKARLSQATAERRAQVLRAWRRQLT